MAESSEKEVKMEEKVFEREESVKHPSTPPVKHMQLPFRDSSRAKRTGKAWIALMSPSWSLVEKEWIHRAVWELDGWSNASANEGKEEEEEESCSSSFL